MKEPRKQLIVMGDRVLIEPDEGYAIEDVLGNAEPRAHGSSAVPAGSRRVILEPES